MSTPTPTPPPGSRQRLFMRIGEGIDFARYDARHPESFSFYSYEATPTVSLAVNLRNALDTLPPAGTPATDAQVLVATGPVTPVPLARFREEDCRNIYDYCFPDSAGHEIYYDIIPATNTVLVFSLHRQIARTLEDTFGAVHYVSGLTPVLRHFADKGTATGKRLFAYTDMGRLHLSVFEAGRLLMVNSYRVQTPTDAAYYILNMARRTGVELTSDAVYVAGHRTERDNIATELRKYAPHVNPINPAAEFNRHPVTRSEQVPYDFACFLLNMF